MHRLINLEESDCLFMKPSIILICFVLLFFSCKKEKRRGIYDKGRIEYKITYLNEERGSFDPAMLPKKMILEFNNEFSTNTINGFMGFFKLENITYFHKKKSITYLKVINKDYIFQGDRHEPMCCFDLFEDIKFEFDTLTKIIAGLHSKHAIATIPKLDYTFDIYYTHDIALEHPNITNPYLDIEGVLTDFVLFMGPYKMRFEASKFLPEKYPEKEAVVPQSAHEVTRNEMVYALERLMEQ